MSTYNSLPRLELQGVGLQSKLIMNINATHVLLILHNQLRTRHNTYITILLTPEDGGHLCRNLRRQEVHWSIIHPAQRDNPWSSSASGHFEYSPRSRLGSFLVGILDSMTPSKAILLDSANEIETHGAQLLH